MGVDSLHRSLTLARRSASICFVVCGFGLVRPAGGEPGTEAPTVQSSLESAASLLSTGRPEAALQALTFVESAEPDNPWLWFYKGSAYVQRRDPYRALEAFDRALDLLAALGDPDPALGDRVRQHRALARQQVFRIRLGTGLAYDSNVSFLGGGVVAPDLIAGRGDGLFSSRIQIDLAPLADRKQQLSLNLRVADSWQFAVESFNYQNYGGTIRYARRLADDWEAALAYDYDISYLGNESFLSHHALTGSLAYSWKPTHHRFRPNRTTAFYGFGARDFLFGTASEFDRDGLTHAVGLEQTFQFHPLENRPIAWDLGAGYQFQSVATQGGEFDRWTHQFNLGIELPLVHPWDPNRFLILPDKELRAGLAVTWFIDDYRHPSRLDRRGRRRDDLIRTIRLILSQKLVEASDAGTVTLRAFVNWTDADSNLTLHGGGDPFTYDKLVTGFEIDWSW